VIRHQAVSVDPDVELDGIVFQPIKVSFVVVIATKRFSSLIAMHDDMVKQAWRKDSGTASHGKRSIKVHPPRLDCSDCDV
jgi:hypothetical protein